MAACLLCVCWIWNQRKKDSKVHHRIYKQNRRKKKRIKTSSPPSSVGSKGKYFKVIAVVSSAFHCNAAGNFIFQFRHSLQINKYFQLKLNFVVWIFDGADESGMVMMTMNGWCWCRQSSKLLTSFCANICPCKKLIRMKLNADESSVNKIKW